MTTARWSVWILAGMALAVAGCDGVPDPTAPDRGSLTVEQAETLLAEAAEARRGPLPTLAALLHQVRRAIREGGGHEEAEALLAQHLELRRAAGEARRAGDVEEALRLLEESRAAVLEAVVLVLGAGVAAEAVSRVEEMMTAFDARLEDRTLPPRMQAHLDGARELLDEAKVALAGGNPASALGAAIEAAHILRTLAHRASGIRAEAAAEAAVERAGDLLARAWDLAGEEPHDRLGQALARSGRLLDAARDALEAGAAPRAERLARESAGLSSRIIRHLSSRG